MSKQEKDREILFLWTRPKKFKLFSWMIMTRLKTTYSHVAMAVYIKGIDEYRIYQASHGDVNSILLRNFAKDNDIIHSCEIMYGRDMWLEKMKYLDYQTGKKYSIWGAVAATFKLLRKMGIGDNGDKSFICSEYAYRTYVKGYETEHEDGAIDSDYVEPAMFRTRVSEDGFNVRRGFHNSRGWTL